MGINKISVLAAILLVSTTSARTMDQREESKDKKPEAQQLQIFLPPHIAESIDHARAKFLGDKHSDTYQMEVIKALAKMDLTLNHWKETPPKRDEIDDMAKTIKQHIESEEANFIRANDTGDLATLYRKREHLVNALEFSGRINKFFQQGYFDKTSYPELAGKASRFFHKVKALNSTISELIEHLEKKTDEVKAYLREHHGIDTDEKLRAFLENYPSPQDQLAGSLETLTLTQELTTTLASPPQEETVTTTAAQDKKIPPKYNKSNDDDVAE